MASMVRQGKSKTDSDHLDSETRKRVSKAGGKARAKKLSKRRRSEIARRAALARWQG